MGVSSVRQRFAVAFLLLALPIPAAFGHIEASRHAPKSGRWVREYHSVGDMYGLGTYMARRYPALSGPAIRRISLLGVRWVREEFTASDIHHHSISAPYHFRNYDAVTDREVRAGFHVLGLLDYNNTFRGHLSHVWMPHSNIVDITKDFVSYVTTVVARYRWKIDYWQVWNEPDIHRFWAPFPNARDYAYLLRHAYTAIKRANPRAQVVVAGPSGSDPHGLLFLHRVVRYGGRFDIVAAQPYTSLPGPQFSGVLQKLHAFGKPIWITELGWAGQVNCGDCGTPWFQASRLATAYLLAAVNGASRMFWYDFRDDGVGHTFEDHFGLVEWNFSVKPAYLAFETSLALLDRTNLIGRERLNRALTLYWFRRHGISHYVVWNQSDWPVSVRLRWHRGPVRILNYVGSPIGSSRNKRLQLNVQPGQVQYLVPRSTHLFRARPSGLSIPPGHTP